MFWPKINNLLQSPCYGNNVLGDLTKSRQKRFYSWSSLQSQKIVVKLSNDQSFIL